ncbi:Uncharacterized protein BP5553_02469 [Venustampulla echinocandica]|uniref:Uncharacterized protein n=1 Tax=Venustampulla echinocandica TaxID=2656787 RepID=A0A370U3X9_9HELO|nr:Uncharacterized protein BP5553_02469 [Venustampulla echinocandica]RDL42490.1 Uncharacterized protein BP5553_02469 [Venustampulla echinocandica]
MRVPTSTSSFIAVAALFCSNPVSASPARVPRAVTESALDAWVSVDASGSPVATITPVLTTISGVATTISAAPASLTATTTSSHSDDKPTPTPGAPEPTSTGGGAFQVCHNTDGPFAPFCKPDNGTSVYVGDTYYITWDTNHITQKNATVLIQVNYVNTSGGIQAFQSPETTNAYGFYAWTIDKAWLKDQSSNNVTLFMTILNPHADQPATLPGPTLEITNKPKDYYRQPKTQAPKGQSLYIALPTVFGFIVLCVCGGYIINRKRRTIGLGNVMGRRNGYGVGKSRSQRLGLGKKNAGAIKLRDQELTADGQYRDSPAANDERRRAAGHTRVDSDGLGSLAGTPTEERRDYFRDDMRR